MQHHKPREPVSSKTRETLVKNDYSYIVVPDFVLHSNFAPLTVSLLVSFYKHLESDGVDVFSPCEEDDRFVLVGDVDVRVHFGQVSALSYRVKHGSRYRIPRIMFDV